MNFPNNLDYGPIQPVTALCHILKDHFLQVNSSTQGWHWLQTSIIENSLKESLTFFPTVTSASCSTMWTCPRKRQLSWHLGDLTPKRQQKHRLAWRWQEYSCKGVPWGSHHKLHYHPGGACSSVNSRKCITMLRWNMEHSALYKKRANWLTLTTDLPDFPAVPQTSLLPLTVTSSSSCYDPLSPLAGVVIISTASHIQSQNWCSSNMSRRHPLYLAECWFLLLPDFWVLAVTLVPVHHLYLAFRNSAIEN